MFRKRYDYQFHISIHFKRHADIRYMAICGIWHVGWACFVIDFLDNNMSWWILKTTN